MKVKAVIFDLDGVIADSEQLSGETTAAVLAKYGITLTDSERRETFGRRSPDIFSDALSKRNMEGNIEEMVQEKNRLLIEKVRTELKPIPNSIELVKWLKCNGYRLALATSSHSAKMQMEVDSLGIEDLFDVIVCGDDVRKGKPDPEIFLKAAEKLGAKPEECVVIEDSQFGVQAAKFAGMKAIAFDSPNTHNQDLSMADVVVDSLEKVKEHVR